MPMYDYLCAAGHRTEQFCHAARVDSTCECEVCGETAQLTQDFESQLKRPPSTGFRIPIIVDEDPATGKFSFPGSSTDPEEAGLKRHYIHNMRDYEKFQRTWNSREREEVQARIETNYQIRSAETRERREAQDQMARRLGISNSRLRELTRNYVDQKEQRKYSERMRRGPNCHSRILEFDSHHAQQINHFER